MPVLSPALRDRVTPKSPAARVRRSVFIVGLIGPVGFFQF
jgi:hypothetical protein